MVRQTQGLPLKRKSESKHTPLGVDPFPFVAPSTSSYHPIVGVLSDRIATETARPDGVGGGALGEDLFLLGTLHFRLSRGCNLQPSLLNRTFDLLS